MAVLGAHVTYTATGRFPVTPAGVACTAELWLGPDENTKVATSGPLSFTSTGAVQTITFPVTMPAGGYEYRVFLDIMAGVIPLALYEATEKVTVPGVGQPEITW